MANFVVRIIVGVIFSAIDALVGILWLGDVFPSLSYWNFFGMAIFGTAIVGTALVANNLSD